MAMATMTLALLLSSCSSELDSDAPGKIEESAVQGGKITFSLDGVSGTLASRADAAELQTAEEKEVTNLHAVVFRASAEDVADSDTFYALATADHDSSMADDEYSITVEDGGEYHICFIANYSDAMKTKLEALTTSSTVADFKALTEEVTDPSAKPMLMLSDFHKANVTVFGANLGTVHLKRVMARIDIVNFVPNVTITKITMNNRAVKTGLLTDENTTDASYLASKDFSGLTLTGNVDGTAAWTSTLYSYEQYATGENAPSITIEYLLDNDNDSQYIHTVEFKDGDRNIPIERNNLYRINLTSNIYGKLVIDFAVADWNEGELVEVSKQEIIAGMLYFTDYSKAQFGDIMLADGRMVKPDNFQYLPAAEKSEAIGIVTYLYASDDNASLHDVDNENSVSGNLKSRGVTTPTGLLLACRDLVPNAITWGDSEVAHDTHYETIGDAHANGHDGHYLTYSHNDEHHTVFKKVAEYNAEYGSPEHTTDWYVPSIGEWIDICYSTGLVQDRDQFAFGILHIDLLTKLNAALSVIGDDYLMINNNAHKYWSSTETGHEGTDGKIFTVAFNENATGFEKTQRSAYEYIRPVLAF